LILLPGTSRAGRSWAISLCLFWLLAYYALLSLGKALGENGTLPPGLAMWFPNIILAAIALLLFRKALHESPLRIQNYFENALLWCARQFAQMRKKG
jgi:lipopolysaccharide export LptBFGC system permease protein LptF